MASLINKVFGYNPTGAFSFGFYAKDSNGGKGVFLAEMFFMLAPESQTIQEGYKIKVTKTFDGAWVDDFGNDVKKIHLKGSLYSFYFGSPKSASVIERFVDTSVADIVTGNYGINEFFKLRWLVSRIRGDRVSYDRAEELSLNQFPGMAAINAALKTNLSKPYELFYIVYHDYDDNNHFNIIFDGFECSRDKSDPYTVNYSISMTALEAEFNASYSSANKWLRGGLKETVQQLTNDLNRSVNSTLALINNTVDDIGSNGIKSMVSSYFSALTNLGEKLTTVSNGVSSNSYYADIGTYCVEQQKSLETLYDQFLFSVTGKTTGELKAETAEIILAKEGIIAKQIADSTLSIFTQGGSFGNYASNSITQTEVDKSRGGRVLSSDYSSSPDASSSASQSYTILWHTVVQGDTLVSLSNKFFGDETYAAAIGKLNNLLSSSFENNALVGTRIKIPSSELTISSTEPNTVYYTISPMDTPSDIIRKVNGEDISLSDDRSGQANSNGDIGTVAGTECSSQNITDAVSFKVGVISEILPEYGLSLSIGDIPREYSQQNILREFTQAIMRDPRVKSATLVENSFQFLADRISVEFNIVLISGQEFSKTAVAKLY